MSPNQPKTHAIQRMLDDAAALDRQLDTAILGEQTRRDRPSDDPALLDLFRDARASLGVASALLRQALHDDEVAH